MKKRNLLTVGLTLLLLWVAGPVFSQVSNDNEDEVYKISQPVGMSEFVPGQVLVKFKDESPVQVQKVRGKFAKASNSAVDRVLRDFGVDEMDKLFPREQASHPLRKARAYHGGVVEEKNLSQIYQVKMQSLRPDSVHLLVKALEALPEVEYAEPNYKVYIMATDEEGTESTIVTDNENPYFSQQWGLVDYQADQLWDKPIVNSERPIIAIIDTGVDITHPDLVDNIWTNQIEAEGEDGYDNDGNGFPSDVHGWDFINNTPQMRDNNMHGTHCAGIAAASNNGIGIIGANPKAWVMPVTVMQSDGTGDIATVAKGVDYAVQNGATVLSLSLGTYANSQVLRQSLERAYQSAVIVAAAGNDGIPIYPECGFPGGTMFPAGYSFVLGVMATSTEGGLALFSNFDCDGPNYSAESTLRDTDGFNYELMAPGVNILSTIPGGKYKSLNGTSMATPLVAGAISALKMVKEYDTQEILWGDLTHSATIMGAYNITDRPAEIDMLNIQMRDRKELADATEEDYSGDHEIDAGETVSIYPVIRTTFGEATNIKMHLEMGDEFEDASVVDILTGADNPVDFGLHLDAYGRGVSLNPLELKVDDNIADNRHIKMKVVFTCDESDNTYEHNFTIVATNMVKIKGLITEDRTLTADHVYYVTDNLGITEGCTLTIEPGTRLEFAEGIGLSSFGKLRANGTPEKPIVFTNHIGAGSWKGIAGNNGDYSGYILGYYCPQDTISYCIIRNSAALEDFIFPYMKDCDFMCFALEHQYIAGERLNVCSTIPPDVSSWIEFPYKLPYITHSNIVNNDLGPYDGWSGIKYGEIGYNNYFNNFGQFEDGRQYTIGLITTKPEIDKSETPSYMGTSREDVIRPFIYEMGNAPNTFLTVDLSNMRAYPYAEAHGIVWKVCVNGKDVQDEYEELAPLGVGKHKFEVYFNRPMNKAVAPQISFGVRDPFTQNAVAEDGSWNEEGTIYTAYKTIDGKTKSDGVNRIYVYGAEDNEYFECPYEKTRFNITVQAAGSMATGFAAEAGMGKVNLTWNNENNNFDDAMGFNIYRYGESYWKYTKDWRGNVVDSTLVADTIRINQEILDIETTAYTDYEVTPGKTYYYYYKVLSTDLQEYDVSNVVAVSALTSQLGDANGSGDVDVADVITIANYAIGDTPKPFIFEAADVNTDQLVDILDVIGVINLILNPDAASMASVDAVATYSIEDGMVYVDTPVALAGVQVQLAIDEGQTVSTTDNLKGFEQLSTWLSENDYLMLAYNMSGKVLEPGRHALLRVGEGKVARMWLSDVAGRNVLAVGDVATKVDRMATDVMLVKGVYDMQGRKLSSSADNTQLKKGVYIINGKKVVK